MTIIIEPICNATGFINMPKFERIEAAERYLSAKGFSYTEDIETENAIMLLAYDTTYEADGESLRLYVRPLGVDQ